MISENVADHALEQTEQRMAAVQCKIYVGGSQESLKDVICTIGNFLIFVESLVDFLEDV